MIDKFKCDRVNYPSGKDDCRKFEKNNLGVALNPLCINKKKDIKRIYVPHIFENITQIDKINLFF